MSCRFNGVLAAVFLLACWNGQMVRAMPMQSSTAWPAFEGNFLPFAPPAGFSAKADIGPNLAFFEAGYVAFNESTNQQHSKLVFHPWTADGACAGESCATELPNAPPEFATVFTTLRQNRLLVRTPGLFYSVYAISATKAPELLWSVAGPPVNGQGSYLQPLPSLLPGSADVPLFFVKNITM